MLAIRHEGYNVLTDDYSYPFDSVTWPRGFSGMAVITLIISISSALPGVVACVGHRSEVAPSLLRTVLGGTAIITSVAGLWVGVSVYVERDVTDDWVARFDLALRAAAPLLICATTVALAAAVLALRRGDAPHTR